MGLRRSFHMRCMCHIVPNIFDINTIANKQEPYYNTDPAEHEKNRRTGEKKEQRGN